MKSLTIGLQGTVLNNDNLGCQALTYSLLRFLEEIGQRNGVKFKYVLFESNVPQERLEKLFSIFNLNVQCFCTANSCYWAYGKKMNSLRILKHFPQNIKYKRAVRNCDVVIDMTQGDSFSDIYGKQRFYEWTHAKQIIEKLSVPLILGPQTIGPFYDNQVRQIAKQVIDKAAFVMTRDQQSADYISGFSQKDVVIGTDLAFMLPYQSQTEVHNKIKVGINPSGLLCKNKQDASEFDQKMKTDYNIYIEELITAIIKDPAYELHLIPHVGDEAYLFGNVKQGVICHRKFDTPIEAKNCIAGMDVFIGARMHATIAAFSSGVATIPTSYSPKFKGLYQAIGYEYLIDLAEMDTKTAVYKTLQYLRNADELRAAAKVSMEKVTKKYQYMTEKLEEFLSKLI